MTHLPKSLAAWGSEQFAETFKQEMTTLKPEVLPLQQGLSNSSSVTDKDIEIVIYSTDERPGEVMVKSGVFYSGVIAGCSCADDPTPLDEVTEHCIIRTTIDKYTAAAEFALLEE